MLTTTSRVILMRIFVIFICIDVSFGCFTHNRTEDRVVPVGTETLYYNCICEDGSKVDPNLEWRNPKGETIGPLGTQEGMHTELVNDGRQLDLFLTFNKAAEGSYQCVSTDKDGRPVSITYNLYAPDKLYFYNANKTQNLIRGQDSLLTCQVRSNQQIVYIDWYRNQDEIKNSSKYSIESTGLRIKNVRAEDAGVYNCTATGSQNGETIDEHITAVVYTAPEINKFTANPSNVIEEGNSLVLECDAEAYPRAKYSFKKIPHNKNIKWETVYNRIVIENITDEHRGVYECTAQNEAGIAMKQVTVEVLTKPVITHFVDQKVLERSEVEIQCKATGRPNPDVYVNNVDYDVRLPSKRIVNETETEFTLMFNRVMRSHSGVYFCNASNDVDYTIKEIRLDVLYKPSFEEPEETHYSWDDKEIVLSCDYDSVPEAEVSWRYYGDTNNIADNEFQAYLSKYTLQELNINITGFIHLGVYECIANNSLGEAKKRFIVKQGFLPSKLDVSKVTILDTTATSANFLIEDHYKQGPKLTGYVAEYDPIITYDETSVHARKYWAYSKDNKYILDALEPGVVYAVRFATINEMGPGEFSDNKTFETPDKSVPEQLKLETNVEYIEIPANQQVLKVQPGQDNGSPITSYAIKICSTSKNENHCLNKHVDPSTEINLGSFNLKPNTTYEMELVAFNALGKSEPSIVTINVKDAELPISVSSLTAEGIIGISIAIVIICILLLDVILYFTLKKGMIATCCLKKSNKSKEDTPKSRDKKGLLKDSSESDTLKRDNGHKEFKYNKETGIVTGKHSAV